MPLVDDLQNMYKRRTLEGIKYISHQSAFVVFVAILTLPFVKFWHCLWRCFQPFQKVRKFWPFVFPFDLKNPLCLFGFRMIWSLSSKSWFQQTLQCTVWFCASSVLDNDLKWLPFRFNVEVRMCEKVMFQKCCCCSVREALKKHCQRHYRPRRWLL